MMRLVSDAVSDDSWNVESCSSEEVQTKQATKKLKMKSYIVLTPETPRLQQYSVIQVEKLATPALVIIQGENSDNGLMKYSRERNKRRLHRGRALCLPLHLKIESSSFDQEESTYQNLNLQDLSIQS
ncbi:hypothetical protein J6590_092858 [Homalodisca vitripennis]|nr:hypothetical protein J6590_092858 [Homalodisca vitripennis]